MNRFQENPYVIVNQENGVETTSFRVRLDVREMVLRDLVNAGRGLQMNANLLMRVDDLNDDRRRALAAQLDDTAIALMRFLEPIQEQVDAFADALTFLAPDEIDPNYEDPDEHPESTVSDDARIVNFDE